GPGPARPARPASLAGGPSRRRSAVARPCPTGASRSASPRCVRSRPVLSPFLGRAGFPGGGGCLGRAGFSRGGGVSVRTVLLARTVLRGGTALFGQVGGGGQPAGDLPERRPPGHHHGVAAGLDVLFQQAALGEA